jgi:hypothetical protein
LRAGIIDARARRLRNTGLEVLCKGVRLCVARLEVLAAGLLNVEVLWYVAQCRLVNCLHGP